MKHIINMILIMLIVAMGSFAKSSRQSKTWKSSQSWGSATKKRPGASKSPTVSGSVGSQSIPLGMRTEKINTSSLSRTDRSKAPVATASPVVATPKPAPPPATNTKKINTASLSDPNRGKIAAGAVGGVAAAGAVAAVASTKEPAKTEAPKAAPTKIVTVNKTTIIHQHNHAYDYGYSRAAAPIIIVGGAPTYSHYGHSYPIMFDNDRYYAEVEGRRVALDPQANGTWDEVAPIQAAPAVQPVTVKQPKVQPAEESHAVRNTLVTIMVLLVGGFAAWFAWSWWKVSRQG